MVSLVPVQRGHRSDVLDKTVLLIVDHTKVQYLAI
jgi:hypothetical protein